MSARAVAARTATGLAAALVLAACSSATPPPPVSSSSSDTTTVTTVTATTAPTGTTTTGPSSSTDESSAPDTTPSAPALPAATEAWYSADCLAQAELRRLSEITLGSTPEQQRQSVEQIYQQHADLALRTRDTLSELAAPAFPGGQATKEARVAVFTVLHEQYTAGLARIAEVDPRTTADLNAVVDEVESAVNSAVAAVPQPPVGPPTDQVDAILALPACSPAPLPSGSATPTPSDEVDIGGDGTSSSAPETPTTATGSQAPATA